MLLSDVDIRKLINAKLLKISPAAKKGVIKSAHIDLRLDAHLLKYGPGVGDLRKENTFTTRELPIPAGGYLLKPGEFILGSTLETVEIPNGYFGFLETKGNIARAGIQVHNTDGHIDPGFRGKITLEIKNNSERPIRIYAGLFFAQLYIFELSSKSSQPYAGKYQNQTKATSYRSD